jgi:PAS domain S-box-containing protein
MTRAHPRPQPQPAPRIGPRLADIAVVAALYAVTGRLGVMLALPPGVATAVWPPSGIALAAVLLRGAHVWPGIGIGSVLVNVWTLYDGRSVSAAVLSLAVTAAIGAGSTAQALLGGALVRRWIGAGPLFDRMRDVFLFAGIEAASCLVASTSGVGAVCAAGYAAWASFGRNWLTWWLGDFVGVLLVVPLPLLFRRDGRRAPWRVTEGACFLSLLALAGVVVFGTSPRPLSFLLVPFVVWAAYRFGQRGAVGTIVAVAAIALAGTLAGTGPYALRPRYESLLILQSFLGVVALTGLTVSAAVAEAGREKSDRRESEDRFRQIVDSSLDAIITIDDAGRITGWNDQAEAIFGLPRAEALGRTLSETIIPPAQREAHERGLKRFRETGEGPILGRRIELTGMRADGSEFPVELAVVPMRREGRTEFSAFLRDLTESRRLQSEVRKSEADLAQSYAELERFNALMVGRELKMVELKRRINELSADLGRPQPYDLSFADKPAVDK